MRKTRSSAIVIALAGSLLSVLTGCVSPVLREGEIKTFELPYLLDYGVENRATFGWHDDYLEQSSFVYSQRLAGPLSALAACVYGYRSDMDRRTLAGLGFDDSSLYRRYGTDLDYSHPKYGKNQVGFTLATKRVTQNGTSHDVLLILLRGTFGRDEWVSNMNMCNTWGQAESPDPATMPVLHEGFTLAADAVQEAVEVYVASNRIDLTSAKVVMTGHSRGAAVANILGARIDDGRMLSGTRPGNLFVYTFATPNTVFGSDVDCGVVQYGNIFNILNPEDIVPQMPIIRWNARRYGTDLFLKNYDELSLWEVWTDLPYNTMKSEFKDMTGYDWWHTPLGTNSTQVLPALLGAVSPTVKDLYAIPPEQRAAGNLTSIHSILETLIYRCMDGHLEKEQEMSLGGDVKNLTAVYTKVSKREEEPLRDKVRFFAPDGRDFSRQPGMFDIIWRLCCMHATQTYIGWMKAAELYGPGAIYKNWPYED